MLRHAILDTGTSSRVVSLTLGAATTAIVAAAPAGSSSGGSGSSSPIDAQRTASVIGGVSLLQKWLPHWIQQRMMNPDALPSVAAGRALQPDLAELAAAFGLSAVSGAVSLDVALCAALPAGKGVQSALLVRQANAAELLRDGGKDWQHY